MLLLMVFCICSGPTELESNVITRMQMLIHDYCMGESNNALLPVCVTKAII
jgi:hypothetical protein